MSIEKKPVFGDIRIIESNQKAECFDCGKVRRVYAVQKTLSFGAVNGDGVMKVILPVEMQGNWSPTCYKCTSGTSA